ncbi:MAG: MSCRAMM family adhesin SdrC [Lachnospiraceae bacterium]|nr:MSCRAMM family adhesin SdrC [Lachnospiraceae bacterium]
MKKYRNMILFFALLSALPALSACGSSATTASVTVAVPAASTATGTALGNADTSAEEDTSADEENEDADSAADETPADQQFAIEVTAGLGGYYKSGAALPLSVVLESAGENFEGVLRVIVPGVSYESGAAAYEQDIMLSADTGKTISMSVDNVSSSSSLLLQVEDAQGNVLQEQAIALQAVASEKALVGILSDDFTALNYFDGRSLEINDYSGSSQVVELSGDLLPEQSSGLDVLSYLIINSYDTSKLSEEQIEAIEEWVREGGIMILGTGSDYRQTLSGFESDFVAVSADGFASGTMQLTGGSDSLSFTEADGILTFSAEDDNELNDLDEGDGAVADDFAEDDSDESSDSTGNDSDVSDDSTADGSDVSDDSTADGSNDSDELTADDSDASDESTADDSDASDELMADDSDAEAGNTDFSAETARNLSGVFTEEGLVFRRDTGLGQVVLTAFNLGMEPVAGWNAKNEMAALLLQEAADGYSAQRIYSLNYGDSVSAWTLSSVLDGMHDIRNPNIRLLAILLLVFVMAAGPVLYLILKKLTGGGGCGFWCRCCPWQ